MSEQTCVKALFDFSDLRKKPESQTTVISKSNDEDFNLIQNENIIKSFKQLRDKTKLQSKQILTLKEQLKIQSIKSKQASQMLEVTLQTNLQQKQKITSLVSQNEQLKKRINIMKISLQKQQNLQNQLNFIKQSSVQLQVSKNKIRQDHSTLLEISIQQKLHLQSQIQRLNIITESKIKNIQNIELDNLKLRQKIMKLQNQLRKQTINYQQQIFMKKWNIQNYQTQHLLQKIANYQKQIANLKNKIKKDKQKKIQLQDKIIQLQEYSGFNNVKAEVFQSQIQIYHKKCNKYQQKINNLKLNVEKLNNQKLYGEQLLAQNIFKNQQLIIKLKEINNNQVNFIIKQFQNKQKIKNKEGKQSLIQEISKKYHYYEQKNQAVKHNQYRTENLKSIQKSNPHKNILTQTNKNNVRQNSVQKFCIQESNLTFGARDVHQNDLIEMNAIENRIRKDRQIMQRRIKEKNLYRNIEASSPYEKNKLRGDYISNFIDKKY